MQSVSRIFSILSTIAAHPDGIGVLDIASNIGLAKSTTSRFLQALEAEAVVRREGRLFFIGTAIESLVPRYQTDRELLIGRLRPHLQQLSKETGETILLAFKHHETISHALFLQSAQTIQLQPWDSSRLPLHVTAEGKLFLALAEERLRADYLQNRPLRPHTDHSILDKTILQEELDKIRAQGFAVADEEFAEDVFGIAVPLRVGDELSAVCFYCPRFRIAGRTMILDIVEKLQATIQKLNR